MKIKGKKIVSVTIVCICLFLSDNTTPHLGVHLHRKEVECRAGLLTQVLSSIIQA